MSLAPTAVPAALREQGKADFSRALSRALAKHDVSQTDLAHELGIDESLAQRWADPRRPDAMTPADIALAGKRWPALGRDLLDAVAEQFGHFVAADDAGERSDASLPSVTGALAALLTTASANEADGVMEASEARAEREKWAAVYEVGAAREQKVLRPAIEQGHLRLAGAGR